MLVEQVYEQNCNFGDPGAVAILIENMHACQIQSSVKPLREIETSQVSQRFDGQKHSKASCAFQVSTNFIRVIPFSSTFLCGVVKDLDRKEDSDEHAASLTSLAVALVCSSCVGVI